MNFKTMRVLVLSAAMMGASGCVAVKIVDTAASAAIGVTKVVGSVAVKGVKTAASVVVPDSKSKKKK